MSAELNEKAAYSDEGKAVSPTLAAHETHDGARKSSAVAVGEAADMYGSVEEAEEYGYVERG
jgi:hypothetical protein